MTVDHKSCDEHFVRAEELIARGDWDNGKVEFEKFSESLLRHFAMEEQVLFPAFESATGATGGPTFMMRMEHDQMKSLLQLMQKAMGEKNKDGYLSQSESMLFIMQQHNSKEEQILYTMIDRVLGAHSSQIIEKMGTVAV